MSGNRLRFFPALAWFALALPLPMIFFRRISFLLFALALALPVIARGDDTKADRVEILVSVADQKLTVLRNGEPLKTYPVSTSRFGLGDAFNTYRTPTGRLKICEKIGDGLPAGTVIKHRQPTREVLPPNAPGRDPIVSRILWLTGTEPGNRNAFGRCVYIHGTPDEKRLGRPVSYGCIRMRSVDVIELYEVVPVGTQVSIVRERLPFGGAVGLLDRLLTAVHGKKPATVKL